jgi:nicotinamide-nucleotide amidase
VNAILLSIGTEIVAVPRRDTNSQHIMEALAAIGVEVSGIKLLADDAELIAAELRAAQLHADVIIATGGLGPTSDDLTRQALALATGRSLNRAAELVREIRGRFERLGRFMPAINDVQADLVDGAIPISNPNGTAPGQWLLWDRCVVFLLPGPPPEMRPMLEASVLPQLRERSGRRVQRTRVLKIAFAGESAIEAVAAPIYQRHPGVRTTILAGAGQVELHFAAWAESAAAADETLNGLARQVRAALPGRVYAEDGAALHEVVARLLAAQGLTLSLAESCTGGLISASLTEVPGASRFFRVGYVCYSNDAKTDLLGVRPELIERLGAVSAEVALAMAHGARARAKTDLALAVTGIAGPEGGSPEKPTGLVFVAIAYPGGDFVRRFVCLGNRARVRAQTETLALEIARCHLLGLPWP